MLVDVVAFDFKACVRYFLFHQMISPLKNYEICFLFHLKSSFRSRNIQIFAIFFSILSALSTFKKTNGSRIIYDVMNWLA